MSDSINHPSYYNKGKIEVIDFIVDQKLGFIEGNIVKYICRYKFKDGLQALKKAKFYLEHLINELEQADMMQDVYEEKEEKEEKVLFGSGLKIFETKEEYEQFKKERETNGS